MIYFTRTCADVVDELREVNQSVFETWTEDISENVREVGKSSMHQVFVCVCLISLFSIVSFV